MVCLSIAPALAGDMIETCSSKQQEDQGGQLLFDIKMLQAYGDFREGQV